MSNRQLIKPMVRKAPEQTETSQTYDIDSILSYYFITTEIKDLVEDVEQNFISNIEDTYEVPP